MDPTQRLQVFQVGVLRHLVGQADILVGANLRNHDDCSDFLDKWIVRRADSIHVARNLDPEVADTYEPLEDVLG